MEEIEGVRIQVIAGHYIESDEVNVLIPDFREDIELTSTSKSYFKEDDILREAKRAVSKALKGIFSKQRRGFR